MGCFHITYKWAFSGSGGGYTAPPPPPPLPPILKKPSWWHTEGMFLYYIHCQSWWHTDDPWGDSRQQWGKFTATVSVLHRCLLVLLSILSNATVFNSLHTWLHDHYIREHIRLWKIRGFEKYIYWCICCGWFFLKKKKYIGKWYTYHHDQWMQWSNVKIITWKKMLLYHLHETTIST